MDIDKSNNFIFSDKLINEDMDNLNELYSWFENRGLINKLRAYVKKQLLTSLKNPSLLNTNKQNSLSPKILAFNLLIADFFIYQEIFITLSVFMVEVPSLENLHEFSIYVDQVGTFSELPTNKPRFQFSEVQDILNALGLHSNSDIVKYVHQMYSSDNNESPLIIIIFKALSIVNINQKNTDNYEVSPEELIDIENCNKKCTNWPEEMDSVLNSLHLNDLQLNTIKQFLNKFYHTNNFKVLSLMNEYEKLKKYNTEIIDRVWEIEKTFTTRYDSLLQEKEKLNHLYVIAEEKENKIREQMQIFNIEHNKQLENIEAQKQELKIKEIKIQNYEKLLKEEKTINNAESIKSTDFIDKIIDNQNAHLPNEQEIKVKLERLNHYKKKSNIDVEVDDGENISLSEVLMDREIIRRLQKENNEFREFKIIQKKRIDELTEIVANLKKIIEKTDQTSRFDDFSSKNVRKKLTFLEDPKIKYYASQNYSSTTDLSTSLFESDNQTEDETVKESCTRLKRLEIHSDKIKKSYNDFQMQHLRSETDYKKRTKNKKFGNDIHSSLSDGSDSFFSKIKDQKISLKQIANEIGYRRSIRHSYSTSLNNNETIPNLLKNYKYKDLINAEKIIEQLPNTCDKPLTSFSNIINSSSPTKYNDNISFINQSHSVEEPLNLSKEKDVLLTTSNIPQEITPSKLFSKNDTKNYQSETVIPNNLQTSISINENLKTDNRSLQIDEKNSNDHLSILINSESKSNDQINFKMNESSLNSKKDDSENCLSFGSNKSSDFWRSP
ncbi:myb-like protein X [Daktulosphaira vitifoliae]|uniref:myb-like protein X n=1 Tax=Daktulosphaira vitifoliae TaxID=58002 RepID=UPI0021AA7956|nr:myb-like protein X [Daktulosphaira vitifoliae]